MKKTKLETKLETYNNEFNEYFESPYYTDLFRIVVGSIEDIGNMTMLDMNNIMNEIKLHSEYVSRINFSLLRGVIIDMHNNRYRFLKNSKLSKKQKDIISLSLLMLKLYNLNLKELKNAHNTNHY